jgi:hypothetical protein
MTETWCVWNNDDQMQGGHQVCAKCHTACHSRRCPAEGETETIINPMALEAQGR